MTDAAQRLRDELASLEAGLDVLIDRESDGAWPSLLACPAPERVEGAPPIADLDLDTRVELACALALPERLGFASPTAFRRWCREVKRARDGVGEPEALPALLAELRGLVDRVWELADSEAGLLAAFERSRITLTEPPGGELIGPGALTPLPVGTPAFVITAENPGGVRVSRGENERRTAELEESLRDEDVDACHVVAGSGQWRERGYLVGSSQLSRDEVLALAARFGQHSVFRLTPASVEIIRVADAATVSRRPRSPGGTEAPPGPPSDHCGR